MDVESRADLRAEVGSIAERLHRLLRQAFQEELEAGATGGSETGFSPAGSSLEGGGDLAGRALERLWSTALDGARPFLDSRNPPVAFYRRLLRRWVAALKPVAAPCFAPTLRELQETFAGIAVLDGARLYDLAHRLHLQGDEGTLVLPGRMAALQDLLRGLTLQVWFEPDAERPDPPSTEEAVSVLDPGTLLLGDERHATHEMFERLSAAGSCGLFRIPARFDLHLCSEGKGGTRRDGYLIQDDAVELNGASPPRRLRRVTVVQEGKLCAVLTDVLDPQRLSARQAIRLAVPRWRVDRFFNDLRGVVAAHRLVSTETGLLEAQLQAAALLGSALRAAQGWIAEGRGLPAAALASEFLFPQIVRAAAACTTRTAEPPPVGAGRAERTVEAARNAPLPPAPKERRSRPGAIATVDSGLHQAAEAAAEARGAVAPLDHPPAEAVPVETVPAALPTVIPEVPRRKPPQPASMEEMLSIGKTELDPAFEPFCRAYAEVGHRDGFLWKWVQKGIEITTLPGIDPTWKSPNRTVKLLGVMLDVLLDDVADNLKDGEFLCALLKVPFNPDPRPPATLGKDRTRYYEFLVEVWSEISRLVRSFPRHAELREVFEFDYRQLLNTMRYAYLVNRLPEILNLTEHDLYQPHNMHMMISGTLDLMCSPGFDRRELAPIRQALWRGQVMGRIGNMVSTWEREIKERDFTSGVFAAAIERGAVGASELGRMSPPTLTRTIEESGVINRFLEQWARLRDEVYALAAQVRSVDLTVFAAGLEELIRNHLGSRGLK